MTDPSIKVSVVIPIYNQEHYLRACLDSLLEQTFTSFEVLAVNDGSTDASAAIVQEYERRDPRFHLIDKPNGGVSAARNTGIAHACGQWIGLSIRMIMSPSIIYRCYTTRPRVQTIYPTSS